MSFSCLSVFQAYRWCIEAMKEITPGLPVKVVVDVLRQASKVNSVHLYSNVLVQTVCTLLQDSIVLSF